MGKIYKKFKAVHIKDTWCVVTDDEGIIIARVPHWLRHPKAVAEALSSALTKSKYALTELV